MEIEVDLNTNTCAIEAMLPCPWALSKDLFIKINHCLILILLEQIMHVVGK